MITPYSFTCSCCGKTYDELPLCFGGEFPDYYFTVPPEERKKRIEFTESLCVIDEEHFFHKGQIIIPIIDYTRDLVFNVWTTISRENFERRNNLWNEPRRIEQQPYFGWLQTIVPTYPDTLNIKTIAHESEVGLTPTIEVIEDGHLLGYDQRNGITFDVAVVKVQEILAEWHSE